MYGLLTSISFNSTHFKIYMHVYYGSNVKKSRENQGKYK